MGSLMSRPMNMIVFVTNVGDYDTFIDATRNSGLVVGPEDWHYTKYGIKIAFESADHASAFLGAVRGLRIGDSKVVARKSKQRKQMVQSYPHIKWPVPTIHDIQAAFCDTYAAAGERAGELQSRMLLSEIRNDERKIYFDINSVTDPGDDQIGEVNHAVKTEREDSVKTANSDEIIQSEGCEAVKHEDDDATTDEVAARIGTPARLPVRLG